MSHTCCHVDEDDLLACGVSSSLSIPGCFYLVGADLGQLACCELRRGLRGRGEAAMNKRVQGDQGGQQLVLTQRETERRLVYK